jgi:hypothetical protein
MSPKTAPKQERQGPLGISTPRHSKLPLLLSGVSFPPGHALR